MKQIYKILALLLAMLFVTGCFAACNKEEPDVSEEPSEETTTAPKNDGSEELPEFVDYASQLKFNPNSGRAYVELNVDKNSAQGVKVYEFNVIDGDTTHFEVHPSIRNEIKTEKLKARYLGINTPESTGEVEPWGKKASNYATDTLAKATSIIIESDSDKWTVDSTGERYLVWVWYKTAEMTEYRNINIEILQQGLAFGSNAASNSYSDYTMGALNQAKLYKLHVFSREKDPDYYYGEAMNVSLRVLKTNPEKYVDKLVKFEGVVAKSHGGSTIYMEEYDPETDMYFGIQVFYGYNVPGTIKEQMTVGSRICMVGTLTYYKDGGYYQVSNLQYNIMKPTSPEGVHRIEDGHSAAYNEVDPNTILNGTVEIKVVTEDEEGNEVMQTNTFKYGELAHFSTVTVKNLEVIDAYTTSDGNSAGAITLTCRVNGVTIKVRTEKLFDENGDMIKQDVFLNKTIDVRGIIDSYNGTYQIKIFSINDVTFH